jgi:hypothetical protein
MKFEDGMKKISAIAWSSTGKKLAIASADKVIILLSSLFIYLMIMGKKYKNFLPNHLIKDKNPILLEHFNSHLIRPKLLLLRVITLYLFTKLVYNGANEKQYATNFQFLPQ